jgi:hypothetical protein
MINVKLSDGFELNLEDDVMDDYDLVMLFGQYKKNPSMDIVVDIAIKMLGAEQHQALMDHLRDEKGKLKTSAMMAALEEVEDAIPAVKN